MLSEFINEQHLEVEIYSFEYPDKFIPHGNVEEVEKLLKLDAENIAKRIMASNVLNNFLKVLQ